MGRHVAAVFFAFLLFFCNPAGIYSIPKGGHGCAPSVPPGVSGAPVPAPASIGVVVMNEVLTTPITPWNCTDAPGAEFAPRDTWVELYNPQTIPLDLYAVHATLDTGPDTTPYYLPLGAAIAPHGFLVLFPLAAPTFVLSTTPTLRLLIAGVTIDQVTIPQLLGDQSYARTADGGDSWQTTNAPTIDASNVPPQAPPTAPPAIHHKRKGQSGTTQTRTPSSSGNNALQIVNGVQPPWNTLHLPGPAESPLSPAQSTRPAARTTTPNQRNGGGNILHVSILILLTVALVCSLLWCWWLFRRHEVLKDET